MRGHWRPKSSSAIAATDSAGYAGRVMDRLDRELGRDLVFMDVDAIPLGTNFSKVLHEEVAKCGVLLAVIGPNWSDARDEHGNRRLDDPNDFVRIEIAAALQRNIPVIPILLDGARIPKADQLPEDLKELALRNGMEIRHASFQDDMNRLIRGLKGQVIKPVQRMVLPRRRRYIRVSYEDPRCPKRPQRHRWLVGVPA